MHPLSPKAARPQEDARGTAFAAKLGSFFQMVIGASASFASTTCDFSGVCGPGAIACDNAGTQFRTAEGGCATGGSNDNGSEGGQEV